MAKANCRPLGTAFRAFCREGATTLRDATRALKHSVDMSLPGIGEDFSLLDTIIAELPELFYAEIFPKLDLRATLNLAQVNKTWRDAVWSVDGVRSMKAKIDAYNDLQHPVPVSTICGCRLCTARYTWRYGTATCQRSGPS